MTAGRGLFVAVWLMVAVVQLAWGAGLDASSPVRIASVFARTGVGAEENSPNFRIVQMAVRDINAHGGVLGRPVEVVEFDTQSTALGARQAARDAVAAGVVAVVGPNWSSQAMAMGAILQAARIPMVGVTTTVPAVTGIGDFIFRVCYTDDLQADALARFAFRDLGARRAAVMTIAGDIYSEGLSSRFATRFAALGGTVALQLRYLQDSMDFAREVAEIRQASPDIVLVAGYTRDSGLILKQSRHSGLVMPFLGGDGWTALEHYPFLDPARGANYYVSHWHPGFPSEASRRYVALLHEEFGPDALNRVDAGNANSYDALGLVVDAIRRAGSSEPSSIRDALAATAAYPGATGLISFKGARDPVKPLVVLRIAPDAVQFVKIMEPES